MNRLYARSLVPPQAHNALADILICRDEVCRSPCTCQAGPLEDANVRAARQGTVDARGVGPSGRYRLRCVVASPWQPARVPADLHGLPSGGRATALHAYLDVL
jgi:hypothetical protein